MGAAMAERVADPPAQVATAPPSSDARPPYGSYGAIIGGFTGLVAATAALERRLGRRPPTGPLDLVLLCAATFKAARAISRERVGSVVREPFVETEDGDRRAPAETPPVERPAGDGLRRALGELVTCTRCAGTWAAAGLIATQTAAPRFGRLLTWTLAAGAGNDFLHAGFAALCERANRPGSASARTVRP
jgi:uncharacterized protein DUF1360